ncbi:hypothetical protein NMY22_g18187 [Coprinellus aureogranulatus]|nr:hypothetical protein NMY22_g18187 [Coprinellus aureogranulatus]
MWQDTRSGTLSQNFERVLNDVSWCRRTSGLQIPTPHSDLDLPLIGCDARETSSECPNLFYRIAQTNFLIILGLRDFRPSLLSRLSLTPPPAPSPTSTTGDPTIADSLKNDGVSTVWADTIPAGTRADVTLQGKRYALAIQQDNSTIISVDGRWGSLQGNVVLYLRRPQGQDVNFAVITSASALNAANVFDAPSLLRK